MSKSYDNYEPTPAKWILPDGTLTDKCPTDGGGGGGKVTIADMPYEALTTSTDLSATTILGSHATPDSVGYLIQADPDNTDNVIIVNEAVIMLKMIPGQVEVIKIPGFDYASVAGTQLIHTTAIQRVMPS